jgi:chromosome segregation ATPase
MAMFGKVLAVLNVLAAIAFLVLAGMDYSQRQNWAHAHFRGEIAIHGLPVDSSDDTGVLPGRTVSSQLGERALQELLRGSQGGVVKTQTDEVDRQLGRIGAEITGAADIDAKRAALAKYLLPLATRGDERDLLIQNLRNLKDENGVTDLTGDLRGYFQRAVSPKKPTGEDRDLQDRRRSIADVLYNIDSSPEGRTRTQTVVGMSEYIGAADRQFANLRTMSQRLRTAIADEQTIFVRAYQAVLPDLSRLADQLKTYEGKLTEQQEEVQRHTVLRNARQAEKQDLEQRIQKAKQDVAAETAALDALQRRLFELEQDFAKLQAGNQRLEAEIRAKETGR